VTDYRNNREKLAVWGISLVIALTLGLQVYSSFGSRFARRLVPLLAASQPPALWPFVDYPMYSASYQVGDVENHYLLFGLVDDSMVVPIEADDFGLCFWHFRDFPNSVRRGEMETVAVYVKMWEQGKARKLRGLRLENHPSGFTGTAMEALPPRIVATVMLPVSGEPAR